VSGVGCQGQGSETKGRPWAIDPPEAMKISVVPAKAGTHFQSNGFPLTRE